MSELLPPVRCIAEDYDPENSEHQAQWVASGKPELPWQATFYEDLQADGQTYVRRPQSQAPSPDPLAEGVALYKAANEAAKEIIFILMTQVAGMLVAFGLFTRENVNDEGADFVAFHESPITNFERAGRNAKSAQALYNAIASPESRAAFPWLEANDEYILNIFASELLPA